MAPGRPLSPGKPRRPGGPSLPEDPCGPKSPYTHKQTGLCYTLCTSEDLLYFLSDSNSSKLNCIFC